MGRGCNLSSSTKFHSEQPTTYTAIAFCVRLRYATHVTESSSVEKNNLQLLGVSEIADLLGVTKQAVSNWRSRKGAFPPPAADLKAGPVWLRQDIVIWAAANGMELSQGHTAAPEHVSKSACVVSVTNAKGGVGKSTLTVNLGWYCFSRLNKRVLLVDLDPQFNLSQYALGIDEYEKLIRAKKPTITSIFNGSVHAQSSGKNASTELIREVRYNRRTNARLDLIPSDLSLSGEVRNSYAKDESLDNFLTYAVGKENYDIILIDCPPTDSMLTDAAYTASDYLLIPVRPEFLSAIGIALINKSLSDFKIRKPTSDVEVAGIVLNGVVSNKDEYRRSKVDVLKASKEMKWPIFRTELSQSDSYPKGSRLALPIFMTEYARWEKVNEFEALAREFAERVGL
jgi:chromosome partitioning protein